MKDIAEQNSPDTAIRTDSTLASGVYWSQDAFARSNGMNVDTADRVATKLAQQFLPMLEQAAADRGYRLVSGVEVECDLHHETEEWETESDRIEAQLEAYMQRIKQKPSHCLQHHPLTVGKEAPYYPIRLAYLCGGQLEFTTPPATPTQSASYATQIKRAIARVTHWQELGREGANVTAFDTELADILQHSIASFDLKRLGMSGSSIGEHINLSIYKHNGKESQTLNQYNMASSQSWSHVMQRSLELLMQSDAALLDSGEQSAKRWGEERMVKRKKNNRIEGKEDIQQDSRVEFRLPGAACNSWLAMLASTAAMTKLCIAVDQRNPDASLAGFTSAEEKKLVAAQRAGEMEMLIGQVKTPNDMLSRFKEHSQLIPLLHTIVDEQITDPEENKENHADVERLKAAVIARSEQLMQRDEGISK